MLNKIILNEIADFGFKMQTGPGKPLLPDGDKPLKPLNIEYVIDDLLRYNLGIKEAISDYFGEITWGNEQGAVKLTFGPYRGLYAVIHKLTTNLKGESVWICKKVIEVKNMYDEKADTLIQKLFTLAEEVDQTEQDSPSGDYKDLEKLTYRLSSELQRKTTQVVLFLQELRRIKRDEHYIIAFGCKGNGVQRLGQKRLDQFQVDLNYSKEEGLIRIVGNEIGDVLSMHRWVIDPSQFNEYFCPTQEIQEICVNVLGHLNSY